MKATLIDTIEVSNIVGEGVTWDARTQHVWWTDIQKSKLYKLHFKSRNLIVYDLPERLGSFGLTTDPDCLVCAFAGGFYLLWPASNERKLLASIEADIEGTRMNDGRLDPAGRFWAGTMVEDPSKAAGAKGAIYSLEDGVVERRDGGFSISNGMAWNKAGTRMYFADSPQQTIWIYDFDGAAGTIDNRQIFAKTAKGAYPDGAIVDSNDNYWSAQWGSGAVVCYSPDGTVLDTLQTEAPQVACAAFGGPESNILFVTSATEDMSADTQARHPKSGHMFIYETDKCGNPIDCYYKLP